MDQKRLLCIGYGYSAGFVAERAQRKGWSVAGTTRDERKADRLAGAGVAPVIWESGGDTGALCNAIAQSSALLVSTPPGAAGCPALGALMACVFARDAAARPTWARQTGAQQLDWIGYLSTNGVYGDHGGAWVDETTPPKPTSARARDRLGAEQAWRRFGDDHKIPVAIFRLPGIYGPGRSALDTVRAGRARRIFKQGQVFSRAHAADIAEAVIAGLSAPEINGVFNIADDEPAPPQDVIAYACDILGVAPPPLIPLEEADLSPMARSFYADNKRVRNNRAKEMLDWRPRFATYREGLDAILKDEARAAR